MTDTTAPETAPLAQAAEKYVIFSVTEKHCALPSKITREVAALEKVFPLPLVSEYVRGIINRYSVPYALIDMGYILHGGETNGKSAQKIIVLKEEIDKIALLVDDVLDFAEIPAESLLPIDPENEAFSGLQSACFEWKGNPVFCLEIEALLSQIRQDSGQRVS